MKKWQKLERKNKMSVKKKQKEFDNLLDVFSKEQIEAHERRLVALAGEEDKFAKTYMVVWEPDSNRTANAEMTIGLGNTGP